jgi:hypothetical protein
MRSSSRLKAGNNYLSAARRAAFGLYAVDFLNFMAAAGRAGAGFFFGGPGGGRHLELSAAGAARIAPGRRPERAGFPFFGAGFHDKYYILDGGEMKIRHLNRQSGDIFIAEHARIMKINEEIMR